MMVRRVVMTPERLLLSRPGFAARPGMPHGEKAFDSDWAYAGQLIASGWADDPASPADPFYVNTTRSSAPFVIDFPECPFIPTVLLSGYYSPTYRLRRTRKGAILPRQPIGLFSINRTHTWVGAASPYNNQDRYRFEITRRSIIMHRYHIRDIWSRWEHAIHYQVFGFAGPDA